MVEALRPELIHECVQSNASLNLIDRNITSNRITTPIFYVCPSMDARSDG